METNKYEISKDEFITTLFIFCNRKHRAITAKECLECANYKGHDVEKQEIYCEDEGEPY